MKPTEIKLQLDEENSLTFDVSITGDAHNDPIYRLVCEGDGVSYVFQGSRVDDGVKVIIPPLTGRLREGDHNSHLEVIIDDKLFVPLSFVANFNAPVSVVAENVRTGAANKSGVVVDGVHANDEKVRLSSRKSMTLKEAYRLRVKDR